MFKVQPAFIWLHNYWIRDYILARNLVSHYWNSLLYFIFTLSLFLQYILLFIIYIFIYVGIYMYIYTINRYICIVCRLSMVKVIVWDGHQAIISPFEYLFIHKYLYTQFLIVIRRGWKYYVILFINFITIYIGQAYTQYLLIYIFFIIKFYKFPRKIKRNIKFIEIKIEYNFLLFFYIITSEWTLI